MTTTLAPSPHSTVSAPLLTRLLSRYEPQLVEAIGASVRDDIAARPHEVVEQHADRLPAELKEELFLIDELTDDRSRLHMLDACSQMKLQVGSRPTSAELVVHLLLAGWRYLDRLRTTSAPRGKRRFRHFLAAGVPSNWYWPPSAEPFAALQSALDAEMQRQRRGRVRVIHNDTCAGRWRLVVQRVVPVPGRIGVDPLTLRCSHIRLDDEYSDMLDYEDQSGILSISARDPRDVPVYRELLGHHLFSLPAIFSDPAPPAVFTLRPLLEHGRAALSIEDFPLMRSVQIARLSYQDGFDRGQTCHRESVGDVLEDLERRSEELPRYARLLAATFRIRFKSGRRCLYTVAIPNSTETNDDYFDYAVGRWLEARGFAQPRRSATSSDVSEVWPALEAGLPAARTRAEWQVLCGTSAAAFMPLLVSTGRCALSVASPYAHAPDMRVMRSARGRIAVCDQGVTPSVPLEPSEYQLCKLDMKRFAAAVVSALGLRPTRVSIESPSDGIPLGLWTSKPGTLFPVLLAWGRDRQHFEVSVRNAMKRLRNGGFIFTMTSDYWSDDLRKWVEERRGCMVPVHEVVDATGKKFDAGELWPDFVTAFRKIAGVNQKKVTRAKPRTKKRGNRLVNFQRIETLLAQVHRDRIEEIHRRLLDGERAPCSLRRITQRWIGSRVDCSESDVHRVLNEEQGGKLRKVLNRLNDPQAMDEQYRRLKKR